MATLIILYLICSKQDQLYGIAWHKLEAQSESEAMTWPTRHEHDSSPSNLSTLCLCKTGQHGSSPKEGINAKWNHSLISKLYLRFYELNRKSKKKPSLLSLLLLKDWQFEAGQVNCVPPPLFNSLICFFLYLNEGGRCRTDGHPSQSWNCLRESWQMIEEITSKKWNV